MATLGFPGRAHARRSVVDTLADIIAPTRRYALSDDQLDSELRDLRRDLKSRQKELNKLVNKRPYLSLSQDEIAERAEREIRRRATYPKQVG